jgi:hypothetical protein
MTPRLVPVRLTSGAASNAASDRREMLRRDDLPVRVLAQLRLGHARRGVAAGDDGGRDGVEIERLVPPLGVFSENDVNDCVLARALAGGGVDDEERDRLVAADQVAGGVGDGLQHLLDDSALLIASDAAASF